MSIHSAQRTSPAFRRPSVGMKSGRKLKKPKLLDFNTDQVLKRVEKLGDLFAPVLILKQNLPALPAANGG